MFNSISYFSDYTFSYSSCLLSLYVLSKTDFFFFLDIKGSHRTAALQTYDALLQIKYYLTEHKIASSTLNDSE